MNKKTTAQTNLKHPTQPKQARLLTQFIQTLVSMSMLALQPLLTMTTSVLGLMIGLCQMPFKLAYRCWQQGFRQTFAIDSFLGLISRLYKTITQLIQECWRQGLRQTLRHAWQSSKLSLTSMRQTIEEILSIPYFFTKTSVQFGMTKYLIIFSCLAACNIAIGSFFVTQSYATITLAITEKSFAAMQAACLQTMLFRTLQNFVEKLNLIFMTQFALNLQLKTETHLRKHIAIMPVHKQSNYTNILTQGTYETLELIILITMGLIAVPFGYISGGLVLYNHGYLRSGILAFCTSFGLLSLSSLIKGRMSQLLNQQNLLKSSLLSEQTELQHTQARLKPNKHKRFLRSIAKTSDALSQTRLHTTFIEKLVSFLQSFADHFFEYMIVPFVSMRNYFIPNQNKLNTSQYYDITQTVSFLYQTGGGGLNHFSLLISSVTQFITQYEEIEAHTKHQEPQDSTRKIDHSVSSHQSTSSPISVQYHMQVTDDNGLIQGVKPRAIATQQIHDLTVNPEDNHLLPFEGKITHHTQGISISGNYYIPGSTLKDKNDKEFSNAHFRTYNGCEIPHGRVAFIGKNGNGKSLLLQVLRRIQSPKKPDLPFSLYVSHDLDFPQGTMSVWQLLCDEWVIPIPSSHQTQTNPDDPFSIYDSLDHLPTSHGSQLQKKVCLEKFAYFFNAMQGYKLFSKKGQLFESKKQYQAFIDDPCAFFESNNKQWINPGQMSSGQKAAVLACIALTQAYFNNVDCLCFDEINNTWDVTVVEAWNKLLSQLAKAHPFNQKTILEVTHRDAHIKSLGKHYDHVLMAIDDCSDSILSASHCSELLFNHPDKVKLLSNGCLTPYAPLCDADPGLTDKLTRFKTIERKHETDRRLASLDRKYDLNLNAIRSSQIQMARKIVDKLDDHVVEKKEPYAQQQFHSALSAKR